MNVVLSLVPVENVEKICEFDFRCNRCSSGHCCIS